jgi:hypothetical protein
MTLEEAKQMLKSYAGMTNKLTDNQGRPKLDQAIEMILKALEEYEKQLDLDYIEENYIPKELIKDYLNKMEKRCDKPKFSVMRKEIEKLLSLKSWE